jgi:hypothetical protein
MRRIALEALTPTASLPRPLYHQCGALLFAGGERIGEEEIALLRRTGIKKLYDLGAGGAGEFPGEETTSGPLPVEPPSLPEEVRRFRRERHAAAALRAIEKAARLAPERILADPRGELRNGGIERAIERARAGENPEGPPWRERLELSRPEPPRGGLEKQDALDARARAISRLAEAFAAVRAGGAPEASAVEDAAREVFALAARDPDLALALVGGPAEARGGEAGPVAGGVALARHAVDVAVLAIVAATELGYALEQLIEVAWAGILHDVGMLRLPEALAAKPATLDPDERRELERHPLHAIEVLRRFPEVPLALVAVVAEEHERPDGSGYPRGAGAEPGEFARVIAAADVYDALTTPRPYHGPRSPHEALRDLAALAARKKLDAKVVRAFMKALSLFPVGTWVRLGGAGGEQGLLARVVRGGAGDLARPVVALFPNDGPTAGGWLDLAGRPDLRIAAPAAAPPSGAEALSGF